MHTFVIAELGSNWRFGDDQLANARRGIIAARECGADAIKFQYVSDPALLAKRRNAPELESMYRKYVHFPAEWLPKLKAMCDNVCIEFMCTAYIPQDIAVIAPLVKRFKVSSFEAEDEDFIHAHLKWWDHNLIISHGFAGTPLGPSTEYAYFAPDGKAYPVVSQHLHCVSAYPCPVEQLNLRRIDGQFFNGLSDHTTSTLTGALAVAAGASYIEKHARLHDTPEDCPDYGHSLTLGVSLNDLDCDLCAWNETAPPHKCSESFRAYVLNIRIAQEAMGDGVKRVMPAEEANLGYRVRP